jgi:heme O synthase-like polyprenyltransferase
METFNNIIIYIFSPAPGRVFGYYYYITALIIILLVVAAGIKTYAKKNKDNKAFRKLFKSYPSKLILIAAILAIYLPARYYHIPFFSMRFLFYATIVVTMLLFVKIGVTWFKKYPAEKKKRDERATRNKYIIKKKKR